MKGISLLNKNVLEKKGQSFERSQASGGVNDHYKFGREREVGADE